MERLSQNIYQMQESEQKISKDVCFNVHSRSIIPNNTKNNFQLKNLKYSVSFNILQQDYIDKKTLNSNWQNRYFVLTPYRLLYFQTQEKLKLKGCFNLASLTEYNLSIRDNYPQIILTAKVTKSQIALQKNLLSLKIEDQIKFKKWKKQLSQIINNLKQVKQIFIFPHINPLHIIQQNTKIGNKGNFWNHLSISVQELNQYSGHLDILLLKSKSSLSCVHRFFMRSQFDHVGILFRDQFQNVYLLEAVQQKGVCISPLSNVINNFHQQYQQMAYRKLIVQDKQKLSLNILENYINSVIGKKYQLSISKLLLDNQKQDQQTSDEQQHDNLKQRTFFCSQLVADIYLKFRVFKEGKSNKFWPKQFQSHELPFNKQFKLSPLMKVEIPPLQNSQFSQI